MLFYETCTYIDSKMIVTLFGLGVRIPAATELSRKKGSDSPAAKR